MSADFPAVSGKKVVKALEAEAGTSSGTLNNILRTAGLSREDLRRLLGS